MEKMSDIEESFWKRVNKTESCWFASLKDGFPLTGRDVYEIFMGRAPSDQDFYYKCDDSICVNPSHLVIKNGGVRRKDRVRRNDSWEERFWGKVEKGSNCWIWKGFCDKNGYGQFSIKGRMVHAHKVSWELAGREISPKSNFHNLCSNTSCVNPKHWKLRLWAGTKEGFWDWVDVGSDDVCWEWLGGFRGKDNYGAVWIDGHLESAPRLAYKFTCGPIPKGQVIRHSCDNQKCVNPQHLLTGTWSDNVQDMLARGRGNPSKGEQSYLAKLTASNVIEIRKLYADGKLFQREIAEMFSVSREAVSSIIRRKSWKYLN